MKNKSNNLKSGLSLIEIVVVIAIMGMILSLGVVVSLNSYKSTIFRSERETLLSILEKARNRSMNNYNQVSHGACLDNSSGNLSYVIFQDPYSSSATLNEYLETSPAVSISSIGNVFNCVAGSGIIFNQLNGNTSSSTITLVEDGRVSVISINQVGRINW